MQQVASLIDLDRKAKNIGIASKSKPEPLADRVILRLFGCLGLMYGNRWTSTYPDNDVLIEAQKEWGNRLSGFSIADITRGLDQCTDKYPSWPPTIGEFKLLCKPSPSELGAPTAEEAWMQATTTDFCVKYSHGVVLAARNDQRCDVFNWQLLPFREGLKLFGPIYHEYLDKLADGKVFTLPVQIEDKRGKPVTKAERLKDFDKLIGQLKSALTNKEY